MTNTETIIKFLSTEEASSPLVQVLGGAIVELDKRLKALEPVKLNDCVNCEGRCTSGAV